MPPDLHSPHRRHSQLNAQVATISSHPQLHRWEVTVSSQSLLSCMYTLVRNLRQEKLSYIFSIYPLDIDYVIAAITKGDWLITGRIYCQEHYRIQHSGNGDGNSSCMTWITVVVGEQTTCTVDWRVMLLPGNAMSVYLVTYNNVIHADVTTRWIHDTRRTITTCTKQGFKL